MPAEYTYQAKDFELTVKSNEAYSVVHSNGKYEITKPFRVTTFNVAVATANDFTIYLNIIRHEYLVVDKDGIVISYGVKRLHTLAEAESFANNYKVPETTKNTLPLKKFFSDARKGMELNCTFSYLKGEQLTKTGFCPVTKVQSNGLYIRRGSANSFLELPYSKRVDYNGHQLSVYAGCYRILNEEEKRILDLWECKRDRQAENLDLLTDSNSQFYRKKYFFEDAGYSYLNTFSSGRLNMNLNYHLISDKAKRGILLCEYDVRTR